MTAAPTTALLYNLDDNLALELRSALGHQTLDMSAARCETLAECLDYAQRASPRIIFCPFSQQLVSLLSGLESGLHGVPVVVVTRHPETREWIDSIEAGASDYCSAPFEPRQLRWIIDSSRQ